jgi:hypothetical protein
LSHIEYKKVDYFPVLRFSCVPSAAVNSIVWFLRFGTVGSICIPSQLSTR